MARKTSVEVIRIRNGITVPPLYFVTVNVNFNAAHAVRPGHLLTKAAGLHLAGMHRRRWYSTICTGPAAHIK